MILKILGAASASVFLVAASAQTALAQAAPAAPAQPALVSGPVVKGLCVFNNDGAISASSVGKAASARMQQLRAQVSAELQAEQQALQTDAQALQAKRTTLTQEQLQQQAGPLQQREEALQRKAQLRERELRATGEKALQTIAVQVEPILRNLYQTHGCSLLLNGEAILVSNPAMDLSSDVTTQLNSKMSTITFDRASVPQQ